MACQLVSPHHMWEKYTHTLEAQMSQPDSQSNRHTGSATWCGRTVRWPD